MNFTPEMINALRDAGVEDDKILDALLIAHERDSSRRRADSARRQEELRARRRPRVIDLSPELVEVQEVLTDEVESRMRNGLPFNARSLGIHPRGIRANPRR